VIALQGKKDDTTTTTETASGSGTSGTTVAPLPGGPTPAPLPGTPLPTGTAGPAPAPTGTTPAAPPPNVPPPNTTSGGTSRKPRLNANRVELQVFDWPEEVDAAIRTEADTHIEGIRRGGRDGREAEEWFVKQGRPVAVRLVSEFKRLADESNNFEDGPRNNEFRSIAAAVDSTLRKIDGWMERRFEMEDPLRHNTPGSTVMAVAKRWTLWWQEGYWKNDPLPPWDAFHDGAAREQAERDAEADAAAAAER
ncbi:MAG: hypothetical protein AB7T63_12280, partial [Planctomycetota bacterium]